MTSRAHRIVVVEDDLYLRRDLVDFLALRGFRATGSESVEAFLLEHADAMPDLLLLDIGLPGRDGLSLLVELKQRRPAPAIVLLTAFGTDHDHLLGLSAGADAYVVKNRSLDVIAATCDSVLRRVSTAGNEAEWALDDAGGVLVAPGGARVTLTHQETLFLRRVFSEAGDVVTRGQLLTDLGKTDTLSNLRNLDNCAARLRRKVQASTSMELPLRSAYGEGYAFRGRVSRASGES